MEDKELNQKELIDKYGLKLGTYLYAERENEKNNTTDN